MTQSQGDEFEIIDNFYVDGDAGQRFRAVNARFGAVGSPRYMLIAQQKTSDGWQTLPLDVVWFHRLYKIASEWPPEDVLGAYWHEGRFCVDYESPFYPWARATMGLDEHARWRACYDLKRKRWLLHRLHLIPEDEPAMR